MADWDDTWVNTPEDTELRRYGAQRIRETRNAVRNGLLNMKGPLGWDESGDEYLRVPRLTTTQRTALTATNGMVVYDTTLNLFCKYENGFWAPLGVGQTTSVTAAYTAILTDHAIACNASAGAFTISLPTAVGINGKEYIIIKTDSSSNAVTVDPSGTETIDGLTVWVLYQPYEWVMIKSNGANWIIVSSSKLYNVECSVKKSAAQSIPNTTYTIISWDTENYDLMNMHDNTTNNSRITITSSVGAGLYKVIAGINLATAVTNGQFIICLLKNGKTVASHMNYGYSSAWMVITQELYLDVNEYIEISVYQGSGAAVDATTSSYFIVRKVGVV